LTFSVRFPAGTDLLHCSNTNIPCWGTQHGTLRKTKHRGVARVGAGFLLNLVAYNLIRIPKLIAA
jgi:hypothetical protein